jgi:hypothetical protein
MIIVAIEFLPPGQENHAPVTADPRPVNKKTKKQNKQQQRTAMSARDP